MQEVADSMQPCFDLAIAWSSTDDMHYVIYVRDSEIYTAHLSGSSWQSQSVTADSQLDCSPTIAVDMSGSLHLAWIIDDPSSGQYKTAYAVGDTLNWTVQPLWAAIWVLMELVPHRSLQFQLKGSLI